MSSEKREVLEVKNRKSITIELDEDGSFIEVCEWSSLEGYDITIYTKDKKNIYSLDKDEVAALVAITSLLKEGLI